ncbi:protein of unknown function [Mitsuaria sp. PDC51]|uniref:DUF4148 domain-containing protein n=1 Tax=unclassified Roseateles TaxID=2626991 RepID=UPI0008F07809|nr:MULTISPECIES: DUF4148 domain-containing protein [unclassified Roseateles]MBB3281443.1 hypothetical protein [Mitsuaria sp. BK037]MBB3293495.1 hypothetical protein [Mitsuaria sp. BK041]MBB3362712.1 hypothetical protein [Mitsuaria sp. BK045]SFR80931.1 protein of unknown function [Mitsuaria sp. PDC51]
MHHFKKLSIPLGAAALAAALAVPAFAQVEEEIVSGPKSRDQVIAELEQARADGTLAQLQGEHSYAPDFDEARGMDVQYSNHQADADVTVGMSSDTSSEVRFSAPAAGGKTRAQVMDELEQARADGTLERLWSEQGYAPEFEAARSSTR